MGRQVICHHETGDADENEPDRGHQPWVRPAQHQARERTESELRNRNPDQRVPDFQITIAAHRAEIERDQIGRRKNREPQECDEGELKRQGRAEKHLEVDERARRHGFVNQECDEQQRTGGQETPYQSRVEPVEPVALIQARVDQRQSGAADEQPENVGGRPHRDGFLGDSAMQAQRHDECERHVLPENPAPGMMLDVPALERRGDVERQLQIEGIDRDAEGPVLGRRVEQYEARASAV